MGCGDLNSLLSYSTVRFVTVKNWKLGAAYWLLNLVIIGYIAVYNIGIRKGYQTYDQVVGTTTIKTKGTGAYVDPHSGNITVYDAQDLIQPPTERDALFVTTSMLTTMNQRRGLCEGNDPLKENCTFSACSAHNPYTNNGIIAGPCNHTTGFCVLHAWCPLENDTTANYISFTHVNTWTTYVKTNIRFPQFGVSQSNAELGLVDGVTLFSFDEMLNAAGFTYDQIKLGGVVLLCTIYFDCDLNAGGAACTPEVTWSRIDDPQSQFSSGFNYRMTKSTFLDGIEHRTMYKLTGIRVVFYIHGQGGKFGIVPLMLAIGSGVGLLSIASIVCDVIMEKCMRAHSGAITSKKYLQHKTVDADDPDHPLQFVATSATHGGTNALSGTDGGGRGGGYFPDHFSPTRASHVSVSNEPGASAAAAVVNATAAGSNAAASGAADSKQQPLLGAAGSAAGSDRVRSSDQFASIAHDR